MDTFSTFLAERNQNNVVAVFNTLFPRPIFFAEDYWLRIKSRKVKDQRVLNELRKRKVLVRDGDDEKILSDTRKDAVASEGVSILYLVLTNACNFSCKYCFEEERHGRPATPPMTEEIAQKGLDLFVKNLRHNGYAVQVQLYGGEPLMNWDVFVFSVHYIHRLIAMRKLPKLTKIIMLTNGSLLDEEKAAFIKANHVEMGLSVDGPERFTNSNRRFASGKNPYKSILRAYALLQKHNIPTMLSITVTPENITELPEIVSWAHKIGVNFIGFNPIGGQSYNYVSEKMKKGTYDRLLTKNLLESFRRTSKYGMYEARIGRKVIEFVRRSFIFTDCGAINSQLIIHPDGQIGYCHASRKYDVGSVSDPKFSIYDKGQITTWRNSLPIFRTGCLRCPAISLCGYGCFHHVIEDKGDVAFRDTQCCSYTKNLMDLLIWQLYETDGRPNS